ncbi:hypothetical protein M0802_016502 [Mischocyttarus mexicanus]|nr:hypothetical protein M0802_016502 [Mischocyttarus mexicanus]
MNSIIIILALIGSSFAGHYDEDHGHSTYEEKSKPVEIPIYKKYAIPIPHPVPVEIPQEIKIPIPQPYQVPVEIPQPYPVEVVKHVEIPVEKPEPYVVEKHVSSLRSRETISGLRREEISGSCSKTLSCSRTSLQTCVSSHIEGQGMALKKEEEEEEEEDEEEDDENDSVYPEDI